MKLGYIGLLILIQFTLSAINGQNVVENLDSNYIDEYGNKQGYWSGLEKVTFGEKGEYEVWVVGNYVQNRKNGKWQYYLHNNQLFEEKNYKNDTLDGLFSAYYESGELQERGQFSNGLRTELWHYFYPNGNIAFEDTYNKGKLNGESKSYYEDGKIAVIENYNMGILGGKYLFYSSEGCLKKEINFQGGEKLGLYVEYYCNGQKSYESTIIKGGLCEGTATEYYESGKIKSEMPCKLGQRNGEYRFYDENGKIVKIIIYLDGLEIKSQTF